MSFLAPLLPITLRGQHVTLEPLVPGHAAEAREAVPVSYTHLTLPTSDLV